MYARSAKTKKKKGREENSNKIKQSFQKFLLHSINSHKSKLLYAIRNVQ